MADNVYLFQIKVARWFMWGYLPALKAFLMTSNALGFPVEPDLERIKFWFSRASRVVRVPVP